MNYTEKISQQLNKWMNKTKKKIKIKTKTKQKKMVYTQNGCESSE